jgi:hypothetical protein
MNNKMIEDITFEVLEEMGFKDKIKKAINKSLEKIDLNDYVNEYLKEELDEWIRDAIDDDYDIIDSFKNKVVKFTQDKVNKIKL